MIVSWLWHLFYVPSKDQGENSFVDYGRVGVTGVFVVVINRIESTRMNGAGGLLEPLAILEFSLISNYRRTSGKKWWNGGLAKAAASSLDLDCVSCFLLL